MTGWPLRTLGELCHQMTVGFVGRMADQYVDTGVPFLRSKDIMAGRVDVSQLKYISPEFHARIRKSRLAPGDVGIVRTGYPGTAAVIPDTLPEANCSDLVIARPGPDLEARYLAFLLNSPWGKGMIQGRLVGAAQQHFNVKVAHALLIPTPPIEEQLRIASILGAYDDLIEVNRRRVAVLEEMARGLFEEWFVRFRFPGHEAVSIVDTPEGPLPHGWEWQPLSQLAELKSGNNKLTKKAYRAEGIRAYSASGPDGFVEVAAHRGPAVIVSAVGAYCGKTWLADGAWTTIANTMALIPVEGVSATYLFLGTYGIEKWPRRGAAQPFISKTDAGTIKLPRGPAEVHAQFNVTATSMMHMIDTLRDANLCLAASRDLLLPRLISGQLSVEAAESQMENAA